MKKFPPAFFRLLRSICQAALVLGVCSVYAQPAARRAAPPKLAPALQSARGKLQHSQVRVQIKDAVAFTAWLKQNLPAAQAISLPQPHLYLVSRLEPEQLTQLASCPQVQFVDVPNRPAHTELYLQNADFTVNAVEALQTRYPQLNGAGITVSVKEEPFDTTDIDFKGRIKTSAALAAPASLHATTMATLLAGAGNTALTSRGAAWQAQVSASSFAELLPDEAQELQRLGITVQNHSYGVGVENYYGLESQAYDAQVQQLPYLLHVFSSGNNGTAADETGPYAGLQGFANLTGQFKVSKNTLSVGAIDTSGHISPLSSRGPTFDGRIKPELVAFGEGGTSEAAAIVAGVGAVVQQAYQAQNGTLPPATLVKAVLLNSADDKGSAGLDYEEGFGNVDALGAVETLQQKRYVEGSTGPGATVQFPITVPPGTGRLKVTLVWHDVPAEPNVTQALVQDLDLVLKQTASGKTWLPWGLSTYPQKDSLALPARRQADHLNNVEQVTLEAPAAGEYQVQIAGYHLPEGEQAFSVAYEFEPVFTWSYPVAGSAVPAGQVTRIRWQATAQPAASARLEYKWSGASQWQPLQTEVPLSKGAFDWHVLDTAGLAQVRMLLNGNAISTETFVIAPQLPLQVGYQCEEEFMLFWPKVAGVDQYQVYRLGEKYMEPLALTADTLMVLNKAQQAPVHYAVVPLVQGIAGPRSLTIPYDQQGVDCYIKSFLVRQYVSEEVLLDLELSTAYGVGTVYLERKEQEGFQVLQQWEPGSTTTFALADAAPRPGRNEYRVRIETTAGNVFFSQTEAAFFTPEGYLEIFPNPVRAGVPLQIITDNSNASQIEILDPIGRRIAVRAQDGAIKTVATDTLKPGVYLVRVYTGKEEYQLKRIVVL